MKKVLFLFLGLIIISNTYGEPVSTRRAERLVGNIIAANLQTLKSDQVALKLIWSDADNSLRSTSGNSDPTYYVFSISDEKGFIVLSGDDDVYPILGYSFDNKFVVDSIPNNIRSWFEGYQKQINWVRDNGGEVSLDVRNAWKEISEGTFRFASSGGKQLVTALWDQGTPYSLKCPLKTTIGHMPTGCVATSAAIIMKYHNWPDVGTGSHSYTSRTTKSQYSATFDTPYLWSSMPLKYSAGSYSTQESNAVATLMWHAGVFSEMDYTDSSSGAYTPTCAAGLVKYMKYDKGIQVLSKDNYESSEWNTLLRNELDNDRPVIYGGSNEVGEGHQFIIDGYDSSNKFSVNWGWSGSGNGFYSLTALSPSLQGTGGNVGGFNVGQDMVVGIKKEQPGSAYNDVLILYSTTIDQELFEGLTTNETSIKKDVTFELKVGCVVNQSIRTFEGLIVVVLTDAQGSIKQQICMPEKLSLENDYMVAGTFDCKITTDIENNDQIRLMYKSSDSNEWKWARGDNTAHGYISIPVETSTANEKINRVANISIQYSDYGNVEITADENLRQVSIYNLTGTLVNKWMVGNHNAISLPIESYSKGIYFIEVVSETDIQVLKIVKR